MEMSSKPTPDIFLNTYTLTMKCIYLRTNLVNGKQYVGQTINFEKRENAWLYKKRYAGEAINNARKKYGTENFKAEILRECETQDELNKWEMYYIDKLNTVSPNGYNLTDGGGGRVHSKISEETRQKMSVSHSGSKNAMYGKTHTKEARIKIKNARLGKKGHPCSEETKRIMSEKMKGANNPNFGKPLSNDVKEKMRQKLVGRVFSEETLKRMSEAAKERWKKRKGN